jgi:hypothetical protein
MVRSSTVPAKYDGGRWPMYAIVASGVGTTMRSGEPRAEAESLGRKLATIRAERTLVNAFTLEKVMRSKAHLGRQLTSTVHELEAIQERGWGSPRRWRGLIQGQEPCSGSQGIGPIECGGRGRDLRLATPSVRHRRDTSRPPEDRSGDGSDSATGIGTRPRRLGDQARAGYTPFPWELEMASWRSMGPMVRDGRLWWPHY